MDLIIFLYPPARFLLGLYHVLTQAHPRLYIFLRPIETLSLKIKQV
jgi:hypothetical protein